MARLLSSRSRQKFLCHQTVKGGINKTTDGGKHPPKTVVTSRRGVGGYELFQKPHHNGWMIYAKKKSCGKRSYGPKLTLTDAASNITVIPCFSTAELHCILLHWPTILAIYSGGPSSARTGVPATAGTEYRRYRACMHLTEIDIHPVNPTPSTPPRPPQAQMASAQNILQPTAQAYE